MKIHSFLNIRLCSIDARTQSFHLSDVFFVLRRQKRECFSQGFVYVEVFSQTCTLDVFISHIEYLDFSIPYFVNPEGTLHHHLM